MIKLFFDSQLKHTIFFRPYQKQTIFFSAVETQNNIFHHSFDSLPQVLEESPHLPGLPTVILNKESYCVKYVELVKLPK